MTRERQDSDEGKDSWWESKPVQQSSKQHFEREPNQRSFQRQAALGDLLLKLTLISIVIGADALLPHVIALIRSHRYPSDGAVWGEWEKGSSLRSRRGRLSPQGQQAQEVRCWLLTRLQQLSTLQCGPTQRDVNRIPIPPLSPRPGEVHPSSECIYVGMYVKEPRGGEPALHLHGNELVRIPTLRWHVYTFSRRQQCSSGYQNGYNQLSSERKCLHASLAAITLHQKAPRGLLLQRRPGPCRILRRISMVLFLISPVIGVSTNPLGIFFFYFCVMNSLYGVWKLLC